MAENELAAEIVRLNGELSKARLVVSTLYHALDDASGVVDKGDDEDYAYQAELEQGAELLGIPRGIAIARIPRP